MLVGLLATKDFLNLAISVVGFCLYFAPTAAIKLGPLDISFLVSEVSEMVCTADLYFSLLPKGLLFYTKKLLSKSIKKIL